MNKKADNPGDKRNFMSKRAFMKQKREIEYDLADKNTMFTKKEGNYKGRHVGKGHLVKPGMTNRQLDSYMDCLMMPEFHMARAPFLVGIPTA